MIFEVLLYISMNPSILYHATLRYGAVWLSGGDYMVCEWESAVLQYKTVSTVLQMSTVI
jgi:hypothetical protein